MIFKIEIFFVLTFVSLCSANVLTALAGEIKKESIAVGQDWVSPEDKEYKVEKYIDHGRRSEVYLIIDKKTNLQYALKVARKNNEETLRSLNKEQKKVLDILKTGEPTAALVEAGTNYVIREYIEGTRGDEWLKRWVENGYSLQDPALLALAELYKRVAEKNFYIGDLNRKNLIWTPSGKWVVVDSGDIFENVGYQESIERSIAKFKGWSRATKKCDALLIVDAIRSVF